MNRYTREFKRYQIGYYQAARAQCGCSAGKQDQQLADKVRACSLVSDSAAMRYKDAGTRRACIVSVLRVRSRYY